MKEIPLHQLHDRTATGIQVIHLKAGDRPDVDAGISGAHRDDHYIFFLLKKGSGTLMIDFNEIELRAPSLYYILPTQVHHSIRNEIGDGWFIAVDTSLISRDLRDVFEGQLLLQEPYLCSDDLMKQFYDLLALLLLKHEENDKKKFHIPVIHGLVQALAGMAAGCYQEAIGGELKHSRLRILSAEFKKLLSTHLRTLKTPSAYAEELKVSQSYLNEAIKKTTGFPVSYWIQQEIVMEAKRLLYYSNLNVKEIAHNIGYEDASYFSRFFRNAVGLTASAFREQYRK